MNVSIMGAGAMGCLWAAHLQAAYPERSISFVDGRSKPSQHDARRLTFQIDSPFLPHIDPNMQQVFSIDNASSIEHMIDCLFICTKSYDALPGLKQISNTIHSNTTLILFQNGLGSQYDIIRAFPDNPVFAAVTTEGANRTSPTNIVHAGKGITRIGPLNQKANSPEFRDAITSLFQAPALSTNLDVQYQEDIWQALWHKLAINCAINPYTAILNCPNGKVLESTRFKNDWPTLKQELWTMLSEAKYPLSLEEIDKLVTGVMTTTQRNISSMLQDVRSNKRTEVDDINGFAARFLNERGKDQAVNEQLAQEVLALNK